jgi:hypothetical protein
MDIILLNKYCAGSVTLNAQQQLNADCNGDGSVGAADLTSLMRYIVNLVDSLPSA